jgi:hypothetical protein
VDTVLVYIGSVLKENTEAKELDKLNKILKADMLIGLLAIYLGL